jgi:FixJ family two-component response regulator
MKERSLVVVIDSDPSVCKALARLLGTAQMDVQTYASSDLYLLEIDGRIPDCIILALPIKGNADGQLFDQLAATGGGIPIVFTTTANGVDVVRHATGKIKEILHKPFGDGVLLDAIQRSIERRKTMPDETA